jgi:two-component system, OmpR family, alkaline phosphatase synthesis response regulator PhoP
MERYVLAVDDEPNIRRLMEVNLQRAGYRVGTAADGREALAKIREERPDMVVLDVMMPQMDGFELLQILKQDPETAGIPVIMLTAKAQDADVFRGWQGGVHMYLTKPFNPLQLLTVARRIFEEEEQPEEGRFRL